MGKAKLIIAPLELNSLWAQPVREFFLTAASTIWMLLEDEPYTNPARRRIFECSDDRLIGDQIDRDIDRALRTIQLVQHGRTRIVRLDEDAGDRAWGAKQTREAGFSVIVRLISGKRG